MIDEDIMEKIIPIPDEEEEMENIEAELAEADFPITNFKKGGVFYHPDVRDTVYRAETACKDNLELLLHPPCTRGLA